jgi:hypothetical protein
VSTSEYDAFVRGVFVGTVLVAPILGLLIAALIRKVGRS